MVNERPCENCKDNTKKNVSENQNHYQQLNEVCLMTNYLTAREQKNLSKLLKIDEKDIRLSFRKNRVRDIKKSETEGNADISTTSIRCDNDRVPHYHLLHGHYHSCHFSS